MHDQGMNDLFFSSLLTAKINLPNKEEQSGKVSFYTFPFYKKCNCKSNVTLCNIFCTYPEQPLQVIEIILPRKLRFDNFFSESHEVKMKLLVLDYLLLHCCMLSCIIAKALLLHKQNHYSHKTILFSLYKKIPRFTKEFSATKISETMHSYSTEEDSNFISFGRHLLLLMC